MSNFDVIHEDEDGVIVRATRATNREEFLQGFISKVTTDKYDYVRFTWFTGTLEWHRWYGATARLDNPYDVVTIQDICSNLNGSGISMMPCRDTTQFYREIDEPWSDLGVSFCKLLNDSSPSTYYISDRTTRKGVKDSVISVSYTLGRYIVLTSTYGPRQLQHMVDFLSETTQLGDFVVLPGNTLNNHPKCALMLSKP